MNNAPKTMTSASRNCAELGISEGDIGGKVKIESMDPVIASRQNKVKSRAAKVIQP
jgi:hypothetical protein